MSYPILYSATETSFDHNGLGILGDCASCFVTEEANGMFEMSMQYPVDGIHFEDIQSRSIIKARPDQFREPQLFRVYNISKPSINGIVDISAQHISYDLSGIPVSPFAAEGVSLALAGLKSNSVVDCPFEFWTDKETVAKFSVQHPASIRSRLGGAAGSILDVYGGEYEFDNYTVKLYNNRGADRGVSVRYGKNLTSLRQEENCLNVATGIYPYWMNPENGNLVQLPEKIINSPGTYDFVKIRTIDFTSSFMEEPTEDQLRSAAERYIKNNEIGVPVVSVDVSFAQLQKSEEYKNLKLLERVSLFDTISVEFPAMKVSAKAKAVRVVYNVLLDRIESVSLGSIRANIADTIVEQQKEIQKAPTKTDLQLAKEAATAWLTNGKGYAYFRKDDNGNIVDILFMDTQDPEAAVNVMRVGQSGIGFSHDGVDGPYESAWTIDGKFNADFIYSGYISASLIKGGSIISEGETHLRPNHDNAIEVLRSVLFPDEHPQKDFYDLDGNGVVDEDDALLALSVAKGELDISHLVSLEKSPVTITIDPSNPSETIKIVGVNMWGTEIVSSFGVNRANLPPVYGDMSVGGDLFVGGSANLNSLSLSELGQSQDVKKLSWKDNGDGTFTLIGQ